MYCSNLRKGIDKRTTPAYNILVIKSVLFQGGVKVSTGSESARKLQVCEPRKGTMGENPNRRLKSG